MPRSGCSALHGVNPTLKKSHITLKFLLSSPSISLMSLYLNIRQVSSASQSRSDLTARGKSLIYRRNRSGPKIDS